MIPDCPHKHDYINLKSYSNHKRWCLGKMYKSSNWKGNNITYKGLHWWIRKHLPKVEFCQRCKKAPSKEVSSNDNKYTRNFKDWEWLCISCHRLKDFSRIRKEKGELELNQI